MILVGGQAIYDFFEQSSRGAVMNYTACPGGAPFNFAVALARLGVETAFLGALSTDTMGVRLAAALRDEGIDGRFVKRTARPTALAIVSTRGFGGHSFSFYGADAAHCDLATPDLPPDISGICALYVGCFPLVQEPIGSTLLALAQRERHQRVIIYDPNVRPGIEPNLHIWRQRFAEFAALADIIKISQEDFTSLFPQQKPETLAAQWLAGGASLVLYTEGERGARLFGHKGNVRAFQMPVMVQDTVGAGDTAIAALVCWLFEQGALDKARLRTLSKPEMHAAATYACTAASITCSRIGADPPTRAELEAY